MVRKADEDGWEVEKSKGAGCKVSIPPDLGCMISLAIQIALMRVTTTNHSPFHHQPQSNGHILKDVDQCSKTFGQKAKFR